MRLLTLADLAHIEGGQYTQSECAGLGFAAGISAIYGGPVGWLGAGFLVWQAAEGGCFN